MNPIWRYINAPVVVGVVVANDGWMEMGKTEAKTYFQLLSSFCRRKIRNKWFQKLDARPVP